MKTHTYSGHLDKCLLCFRMPNDPIHSLLDMNSPLIGPDNTEIAPTCAGHTCPSCKDTWKHSYDCKGEESKGLCFTCAQQTAAAINRPNHVEEMALSNSLAGREKILTNHERAELHIAHNEFVVQNITHIPGQVVDGQQAENPNWQADLAAHIQQLERMIEQSRIKISAAHQARAAQEVQDLNKLTPEQREQYARDASKPKKVIKAVKEVSEKPTGNKREKTIVSMLKLMGKSDTPDNRKFITQNMLGEE